MIKRILEESDLKAPDFRKLIEQLTFLEVDYLLMLANLSDSHFISVVLEEDTAEGRIPIGYGSFPFYPTLEGITGVLEDMVIHRDYRDRELGGMVYDELERILTDRGSKDKACQAWLTSNPNRKVARGLYQGRGYDLFPNEKLFVKKLGGRLITLRPTDNVGFRELCDTSEEALGNLFQVTGKLLELDQFGSLVFNPRFPHLTIMDGKKMVGFGSVPCYYSLVKGVSAVMDNVFLDDNYFSRELMRELYLQLEIKARLRGARQALAVMEEREAERIGLADLGYKLSPTGVFRKQFYHP